MDNKKEIVDGQPVDPSHADNLVLGTAGGPLELNLAAATSEAIANGRLIVDGKGDPDIARRIFEMARSMGTQEHFEWINALTGGPGPLSERVQAAIEARESASADASVTDCNASQGFVSMDGKADNHGGVVLARADLSALSKASKEDAEAILKNCRVKIFMKLEDAVQDGAAK